MKRVLFIALVAALAFAFAHAAAAQKLVCTQKVFAALTGERTAIARYEASAAKATEEGYPGAAALFRAAAQAEQIHANRFAAAMKQRGIDVPGNNASASGVGSTADNLRNAASNEQTERDGAYREAIEACKEWDPDMSKLFDVTRDAETEHFNLFADAARNVNALKEPATFYVCEVCGYVTSIKLPLCPSCRDQHAMDPVH
jgi:rubrerythrin